MLNNKSFAIVLALSIAQIGIGISSFAEDYPNDLKLQEAIQAYDAKQFDRARSILISIEKEGNANEITYYYLGLIAHDKEEFQTAEKYYRKAIATNSQYAPPYSDLSVLLLNSGDLAEAEEMAITSTEIDPAFVKGFMNLAAIQYNQKRYQDAYNSFVAAARIDPDAVSSQGDLMILGYNDPKAALYYYGIVLRVMPDHPLALLNSGVCNKVLGRIEEAEMYFQKAYEITSIDREPFNVAYSSYFRLLLDTAQYEKIVEHALDRVDSNYMSAQYFLSLAYFKMPNKKKEFEEAASNYFSISGEKKPRSLQEWAEEQIKPPK